MKRSMKLQTRLFIFACVLSGLTHLAHADGPIISSSSLYNCAIAVNGALNCWGINAEGQATPPSGTFNQVSAGFLHACAVRDDSTVVCWGNNSIGGQANPKSGSFTQVSAGGFHTCGLRPNNTVDCWGDNFFDQSRLQTGTFTQISAGFDHNCGVRTDGQMTCWGLNEDGQASPPDGDFVQVSAGDYHTCAIHSNGSVSCWGWNDNEQATPPSGTFKQISAGWMHTCGVRTDNTVSCWGNNAEGQASPPEGTFIHVSAGDNHSCGLRTNGEFKCWGLTNAQDLRAPFSGNSFTAVSTGYLHTCGLKTDGTVDCAGRNLFGESGPPNTTFSKVGTGDYHSCGLRSDGTITCWGNDSFQQSTPPSDNYIDLDAGTTHNCGIRSNGTAACWGSDSRNQSTPAGGTYAQISAGHLFSCGLRDDGAVDCWGYDRYGQASPPSALSGAFSQISAGIFHACGTLINGAPKCWGLNHMGQREPPPGNFKQISAGFIHSCGVKTDGSVVCWGGDTDGQASPPGGSFAQVHVSDFHSCGLRTDGTIACWGFNPVDVISPPNGLVGETGTVSPPPIDILTTRLLNISTKGPTFGRGMEAGFIVIGQEQRFAIMGENENNMNNPVLRLYPFQAGIGKGPALAQNDNWRDHPTAAEVESQLRSPRGERDAAFAITLPQGAYVAELIDASGQGGQGLLSVTAIDNSRLFQTYPLNISTRGPSPMTAGFITVGTESRCYVIKAEGPILNAGQAAVSDPALVVRNFQTGEAIDANDDWQDHPSAAIVKASFPPADSKEAALAIRLDQGIYIAELYSSRASEQGQDSIISVTELPEDKLQQFGCNTEKTPTVPPIINDKPSPVEPALDVFISQPANNQKFDTGESITFKATTKIQPDTASASYNWNFGGKAQASSTTESLATVRFNRPGRHAVNLTVNSNNGLSQTQQVIIEVIKTEAPDSRK